MTSNQDHQQLILEHEDKVTYYRLIIFDIINLFFNGQ
jgi:hypothetical protein